MEASFPQHNLADPVGDVHGVVVRVPVPITQSVAIGARSRRIHAPCNVVVFTDFPDGSRVRVCHRGRIHIASFDSRACKSTDGEEEGRGDGREARELHCYVAVVGRGREVVVKGVSVFGNELQFLASAVLYMPQRTRYPTYVCQSPIEVRAPNSVIGEWRRAPAASFAVSAIHHGISDLHSHRRRGHSCPCNSETGNRGSLFATFLENSRPNAWKRMCTPGH